MKRVIIAEDDTFLRHLITDYLAARGYLVSAYAGGEQASRAVRDGEGDILITDILMEEGEGISTIHGLRREASGVRIVAVSSNERYLDYARSLGADCTMRKPIRCCDLLKAVEAL